MKTIIPTTLVLCNLLATLNGAATNNLTATNNVAATENVAATKNGASIKIDHPFDVGFGHAHIIHDLQNRMEVTPPKNQLEYLHAVSLEMRANLCEAKDPVCNSRIVRKTLEMETGPKNGHTDGLEYVKSIVPEAFDPVVMGYMDKLFFTMSLAEINMEQTSKILTVMHSDLEEMLQDEHVKHERSRQVGMIAYSVAMESTKQWTEIMTDESNPFNVALTSIAPQEYHDRKLQFDQPDNTMTQAQETEGLIDPALEEAFLALLEADLIGATEGAIAAFMDSGNHTMVAKAVEEATMASLKEVISLFLMQSISGSVPVSEAGTPGSVTTLGCDVPDIFWCNPSVDNIPDADTINTIIANVLPPVPPGGLPPPGTDGNGNPTPPGQGPGDRPGTGTPPFQFDPCSIPNNPLCPGNVNNVNQNTPSSIPPPENTLSNNAADPTTTTTTTTTTSSEPTDPADDNDCLFPNNPSMCVDGGNNIPDIAGAIPTDPSVNIDNACITFPNMPICQNGGTLPAPDPNRPPPPLPPFLQKPQPTQTQTQPTQTQPQQAPAVPSP